MNYSTAELQKRRNTTKDFFRKEQSDSMLSVLHSEDVYAMKNLIHPNMTQFSSFPWEEFNDNMNMLEKQDAKTGRAFLMFPMGMLMSHFDDTFGEKLNYYLDDVPGLINFTVNAFTFKDEIRDQAEENLHTIAEHFKENNSKKFKKKQEVTFVGIHHRRGDHVHMQKEGSLSSFSSIIL